MLFLHAPFLKSYWVYYKSDLKMDDSSLYFLKNKICNSLELSFTFELLLFIYFYLYYMKNKDNRQ